MRYRAVHGLIVLLLATGFSWPPPPGEAGSRAPQRTLSQAQVEQALQLRARLTAPQQAALNGILGQAAPAARPYLVRAFAAGHSVAEVGGLARAIAGQGAAWLRVRLAPLGGGDPGALLYQGGNLSQYDDTTCGSTTIVAARMILDPLYAFDLTTGGRPGTGQDSGDAFERRLREAESATHRRTASWWPEFAGTPPWGLSNEINRSTAGLPVRYHWRTVTPAVHRSTSSIITQALAAARLGYPVPLLVGDLIPRHYVLLLGRDRRGVLILEPTSGEVRLVTDEDLARHDFSAAGWPHLLAALVPVERPASVV